MQPGMGRMQRPMEDPAVVARVLALEDAGQMSTELWEAMGFPFEGFLKFCQLDDEQANRNLRTLQGRLHGK